MRPEYGVGLLPESCRPDQPCVPRKMSKCTKRRLSVLVLFTIVGMALGVSYYTRARRDYYNTLRRSNQVVVKMLEYAVNSPSQFRQMFPQPDIYYAITNMPVLGISNAVNTSDRPLYIMYTKSKAAGSRAYSLGIYSFGEHTPENGTVHVATRPVPVEWGAVGSDL